MGKLNTSKGILYLTGVILGVGVLWQALEFLIYGEVQPRLIDDIISIIWAFVVAGAYIIGERDRSQARITQPCRVSTNVKLFVLKTENELCIKMEAEVDGQTIGMSASYPEEVSDRIIEYLSRKGNDVQ